MKKGVAIGSGIAIAIIAIGVAFAINLNQETNEQASNLEEAPAENLQENMAPVGRNLTIELSETVGMGDE